MLKLLKQKKKYKRVISWDEEVVHFAVKVVGSVAFFFIAAIGMDIYHFFH